MKKVATTLVISGGLSVLFTGLYLKYFHNAEEEKPVEEEEEVQEFQGEINRLKRKLDRLEETHFADLSQLTESQAEEKRDLEDRFEREVTKLQRKAVTAEEDLDRTNVDMKQLEDLNSQLRKSLSSIAMERLRQSSPGARARSSRRE